MRSLFLLRPDVVFLNHGSFGACPRPVFDAYQRWQLELERQPVEFLGRRFKGLMADARAALGAFVGADPDDLIYVPNATRALNTVARSIPLEPGDEVLSTDHEYGALDRTWTFICERRSARYVRAQLPSPVASPEEIVERIWAHVTARTRVLFTSHITAPTALIFPIAELIHRARDRGILTVIDGAHAPGQIPLALETLGADFYAGNCHKWLCAPKGSGFLYARRERQAMLSPLVISWGWREGFVSEHEWQGTRDIAAYLTVPDAVAFLEAHLGPETRARCHALARTARQKVTALTGLPPLSPDGTGWYAQMVSMPLPVPVSDAEAAQRRLHDDFRIEVPIVQWTERALLRVSVHLYNDRADIDALCAALRAVLAGG